jgi:type IX secretion system substrate protein/NHL repeat-containing protein
MVKCILLLIFFGFCLSMNTTGQTIATIAGGMQVGYSGDGGPATNAVLNNPQGITVDAAGNVFFADGLNNCVRMINTSGIIQTIAGTGISGYSGDGGPGTLAELHEPACVAVDAGGNVYIAEYKNHCIRKVYAATGIITTFAGIGIVGYTGDGGPATAAELRSPYGVAADRAGNVYIADLGNFNIRKVSSSGIISTIAGNGIDGFSGDGGPATNAALRTPNGVATDTSGNIFIADAGNDCVRKIDVNGIITTVAGNRFGAGTGTGGYGGDGGPATAAALNKSDYIAIDYSGSIYIADHNNQRIRKVNAAGIITTIAGDGTPGYNGDGNNAALSELYNPNGVAVDTHGNIYIADQSNNRIRVETQSSVAVNQVNDVAENVTNYPNPFKDQTMVSYYLNEATENVLLEVTNVFGQKVYAINLGAQNMGNHQLLFNEQLPAGVYNYTIGYDQFRYSKKMVISK